ncbi:MAG TPA: ribosome silencing factor [Bacteroidales bacterium]|nr:ribosome silencing factor [Bacteroidales bacterium]HPS15662.1 ribosome silencing factor [Bacteroidales bacterium]
MAKRKKKTNISDSLSEIVIKGIQEKKGKNIVSMNLKNIHNAVSDYFIVCHGTSSTQVEAIAESIEREVRETTGLKPWHREGFQNAEWILLDYVDVVVHIFQEKFRSFYQIESLWADAEVINIKSE